MALKSYILANIFLICVTSMVLSEAFPATKNVIPNHKHQKRNSFHFCGKQLVTTLFFVCNRQLPYDYQFDDEESLEWKPSYFSKRIPDPQAVLEFFPVNQLPRSTQRSIVHECCINSCSVRKLRSYCGMDINEN